MSSSYELSSSTSGSVHEGFQNVEPSQIPRSAVKACTTGSGTAGVWSATVSSSPSGSSTYFAMRSSSDDPLAASITSPSTT